MRIFISYRREDHDAAQLGRQLHMALSERDHRVFFDVASKELGANFEIRIREAINQSDVVLVLIGSRWGSSFQDRRGQPDYVRSELVQALSIERLPVIPVLVHNTPPPLAAQLPPELAPLALREFTRFDVTRFDRSLRALLDEIPRRTPFGNDPTGRDSHGCDLNYFSALSAPFQYRNWFRCLWWVGLLVLLPPPFNVVVCRGWRLDLARRIAFNSPSPFPYARDFIRFLKTGVILWLMTFLYALPFLLLLIIVDAAHGFSVLVGIFEFVKSIVTLEFDIIRTAFGLLVRAVLKSGIVMILILVLSFLFGGPLYRCAAVRYAIVGRKSVFLQVMTNARITLRNYRRFLFVYVIDNFNLYIVSLPIAAVLAILGAPTGIVPIFGVMLAAVVHYWVSGYLYGQLGKCVLASQRAR
jgi:hypothetical protein